MRSAGWPDQPQSPSAMGSGEERLTQLVRSYGAFIWRVLRRLGLSPENAEDASQQVFMILAQKIDQLPHATERVFLYGTALRVAANARRGARRRRECHDSELDALASTGRGPELELEQQEELAELDALLARLPDELRRVLILSELEELKQTEIAELEGIPVGTVASRLRRARELVFSYAQSSVVLRDRLTERACAGVAK